MPTSFLSRLLPAAPKALQNLVMNPPAQVEPLDVFEGTAWKLLPDNNPAATQTRVMDLTACAEQFVINVRDGRLCSQNGDVWDTQGKEAKFVMSQLGVTFGAVKFKENGKSLHHSSFLRDPVAAAGLVVVEAGIIKYLICDSGHYAPTPRNMAQFLQQVQKSGTCLVGVRVGFHGTEGDDFLWVKAEDCLEFDDDAPLELYGVVGPDRTGKKDKASLSRSSTGISRASTQGNLSWTSGSAA